MVAPPEWAVPGAEAEATCHWSKSVGRMILDWSWTPNGLDFWGGRVERADEDIIVVSFTGRRTLCLLVVEFSPQPDGSWQHISATEEVTLYAPGDTVLLGLKMTQSLLALEEITASLSALPPDDGYIMH